MLWYELHYHKTGRNAVDFYRIICIRDESFQDSEANTLRSFTSVPLLGMTGTDVRAGSCGYLLNQQTLVRFANVTIL